MAPKPEDTQDSRPLHERIRAATKDPLEIVKVDRFTRKLNCHRGITLAPVGNPDALDPNKVHVTFQPGTMLCIGAACTLWNSEDLECFDTTQARATRDTAKILNLIDGHARMSAEK
jgi:hypothetical protein